MARILLLTDFSSGYSRSLLKGIVRYSNEFGPWVFYKMPLYYKMLYGEKGVMEWVVKWRIDAIIAQLEDIDVGQLRKLNIPIIVQNYHDRTDDVSNLTGDYFNTGVMAADFFLMRGYRNFAFYGFSDTIWSRERGQGFKTKVEEAGFSVCFFEEDKQQKELWVYNPLELGEWLKSLPKPVALFACDDSFALQISETCNLCNIQIPDEVTVLGVDNDQLICNISNPPLSSIVLDVENGGYRAAQMLHKLINKEIAEPTDIVINPIRIEYRKSTEKYAVLDKNINTVFKYIEDNYMHPISVNDLIKQLPLSRRVLERKFKQETGISIYQYIQQYRIKRFANLLVTTDKPLAEIALMAGFDDYKNVFRIFRKYMSVSPIYYRKQYQPAKVKEEK
ncbi:xylose operon transcription regulator XylR [Parabacteroides bouchesdurhonensis]|uniref:AraC family transcriptional regulator n=1 Tax=Parabacteroides bouchesdurhonensis TaxID=1936995 RepID=UPI000E47D7B5|nr:DNA-binding transcriptional regulator [Parabacteroides bouchesdurhonensis]RHJ91787.1 helix-turn-helix domain-containing protein [Bacteroides sp. AM07-16]